MQCLGQNARRKCIAVSTARLNSCDVLPGTDAILVCGDDSQLSLWDCEGRLLWRHVVRASETRARKSTTELKLSTFTSCRTLGETGFLTCTDNCLQRWSLEQAPRGGWEAACMSQVEAHDSQITSVCVYKGGSRAVTTSKDGTARVWDTKSMALARTFENHGCEVYGAAALEDGRMVVSTGQLEPEHASVLLWCPETGEVLHTLGEHSGWLDACDITSTSWGSGGEVLVAAAGVQGVVHVWDAGGRLRYRAALCIGACSSVKFSACGGFLLVGGYDRGEVLLLEARFGQELLRLHTVQEPARSNSAACCFFLSDAGATTHSREAGGQPAASRDDKLATCSSSGRDWWDTRTVPRGSSGLAARYYTVGPDSSASQAKRPASAATNQHGRAGGAKGMGSSNRIVDSTAARGAAGCSGNGGVPQDTGFTFPTRLGAVCSDGSIRVFNVLGRSYDDSLQQDPRMHEVYDADVSADGSLLAAVYMAGRFQEDVCLYDFHSGELLASLTAHRGTYGLYVALAPDARLLRPDTGADAAGGVGSGGRPCGSLVGRLATVGADRGVRIFDLASRQLLRVIDTEHTQDSVCANFSAAFDRMLTSCDGNDPWIPLWDVERGDLVRMYDTIHTEGVYDATFTADGLRCLSVSCDKTAALFDLQSGHVIQRFVGHTSWVRYGALSPDERTLATCSNDGTVRLWDVGKGTALHVLRQHRGTTAWASWLHPAWLVSCARDGTVMAFNLQAGTWLPLMVSGPVGVHDSVEKLRLLPAASSVAGPRFPSVLALTSNGKLLILTLGPRQPLPDQVLEAVESGLWSLEHVARLAEAFPGLALVPMQDGDTLLHRAITTGRVELLRTLLGHDSSATAAPLPANAAGRTPLDCALEARNLQCVELLLASEVMRAPPLRLAVVKAWAALASEMPSVLVKFLNALGIEEPSAAGGAGVILVPVREGVEVLTCGSQELDPTAELWKAALDPPGARAVMTTGGKDVPHQVLQPVVPGVCGLPYIAVASRSMADSPLGALVVNKVADAFATDIGFAMLTYKWQTYAGTIYRQQAALYLLFMLLYVLATTLGVSWDAHVSRYYMYGDGSATSVARIVLEAAVVLMDAKYLLDEARQLQLHGVVQYMTGYNSAWNWLELLSGVMVILVICLQVAGCEEARWLMSSCTVLLGLRLLKVASGFEGTGIFVQIILRIILDLQHFLLVVGVTLLTYALAFWQVMVYYEQVDNGTGISPEFTDAFNSFPTSILSVYYFMTVGGVTTNLDGRIRYVWYLHVLLISFSFIVSIILLNLLIAVMSDTYVVVKQRAKSEWMLLKARLILEIDSNMPDKFFSDPVRSAPMWLHVINIKRAASPEHASLLDSVRGTVVRQALNTDVSQTKAELMQHMGLMADQLRLLQRDVARLSEALAAGRAHTAHAHT